MWFLEAPHLERRVGAAPESPACHLASWQAAEPSSKLSHVGATGVKTRGNKAWKIRCEKRGASEAFLMGVGSHQGQLCLAESAGCRVWQEDRPPSPLLVLMLEESHRGQDRPLRTVPPLQNAAQGLPGKKQVLQ